ncbi:hypothetical protein E2C01_069713 [Portunus trituberculatus]|uniref:Uncharacterized protein n=1 Tax=Portunus trituberculatus TaxID=210409 RepID=A0A5B7I1J3_PORTR|nr:hypothetical protein [Portunus trituberculatus]
MAMKSLQHSLCVVTSAADGGVTRRRETQGTPLVKWTKWQRGGGAELRQRPGRGSRSLLAQPE